MLTVGDRSPIYAVAAALEAGEPGEADPAVIEVSAQGG
jgi:hypothetical protein